MKFKLCIREMRVHHYIKNFLIFFPLFFGGEIFSVTKLFRCVLGFVAFSVLSSTVYIINDIFDRKRDALHPTKKFRPIASGSLSVKEGLALCAILYIIGIALLVFLRSFAAAFVLAFYLVMNFCYSLALKNIPILDIVILSAGFLLRLSFGSILSNVEISLWLFFVVMTASLFFAMGKRRGEFKDSDNAETRKVLELYSVNFLDKNMYVFMALTDVFYALWTMASSNARLAWTVPLFILITMRYSLDVENDGDSDPVKVLLGDKSLITLCAVYCIAMYAILYF